MVLIAIGVWLARRRAKQNSRAHAQPPHRTSREMEHGSGHEHQGDVDSCATVAVDETGNNLPSQQAVNPPHQRSETPPSYQLVMATIERDVAYGGHPESLSMTVDRAAGVSLRSQADKDRAEERSLTATMSTANMSTAERAELGQFRQSMASAASVDDSTPGELRESRVSSTRGRRGSRAGVGVGEAVMKTARDLAYHCQIPGVSEAAAAVSTLIQLVSDSRDVNIGCDANLRQCRTIVLMLDRASKVAGEVRCGVTSL